MVTKLTDPAFTLTEFAEWLRAQPADGKYNYSNHEQCALAQFLLATGRMHSSGAVDGWGWFPITDADEIAIDDDLSDCLVRDHHCSFSTLAASIEAEIEIRSRGVTND